jgi:cyclohexadienyl dehydratase
MKRAAFLVVAAMAAVPLPLSAQTDRLAAIRARGVLRAGMTGDYLPFTYRDAAGTWSGFDVDAARALAAALGVRPAFVKTEWPAMTGDLLADRFDIAMGGVSTSPARATAGLLTRPYCRDGKVALIRSADAAKYHSLRDLDVPETRVAVNPGGTNETFVSNYVRHAGVTVVAQNLAIAPMVAAGTYDVMFTDGIEAAFDVRNDPRLAVMNPDAPFTSVNKVYFVPKDGASLVAFVDDWLAKREADGSAAALRMHYFGSAERNAPQ